MDTIIWLFLYLDSCLFFGFYLYVRKIKKRIGFQLGMNISMAMGGMMAMLSGVLFILQFPFHFTYITMLSALVGMGTGAVFGHLFDYQTFVTGLTNGAVVGLMSPMIGTVVEMPVLFVWSLHILFVISLMVILSSIQRS
ncbi:hypothetical protein OXB_0376 [Bacillus sp. OxB-1]|uniref:hypothetical protein n=1 Tax=Bacillus sp. (strain OxB-1) TaxID=98228 RepID=UPI000581B8A8|nr:hypothetical protein [Bacillus sp. OxB-1]BAQ08848.1 hypothetical protein OXB_0376 [Bacillus sp. OxB-1]